MAASWLAEAAAAQRAEDQRRCVQCQRPVVYINARTPYEKIVRYRQINFQLCERCARVTVELADYMDGLWRKKRFIGY